MFVFTSALLLLFLCLFCEGIVWILLNFRFLLKPLFFKAFSYKGFALSQLAQRRCENVVTTSWLKLSQRCGLVENESCSDVGLQRCGNVRQQRCHNLGDRRRHNSHFRHRC